MLRLGCAGCPPAAPALACRGRPSPSWPVSWNVASCNSTIGPGVCSCLHHSGGVPGLMWTPEELGRPQNTAHPHPPHCPLQAFGSFALADFLCTACKAVFTEFAWPPPCGLMPGCLCRQPLKPRHVPFPQSPRPTTAGPPLQCFFPSNSSSQIPCLLH